MNHSTHVTTNQSSISYFTQYLLANLDFNKLADPRSHAGPRHRGGRRLGCSSRPSCPCPTRWTRTGRDERIVGRRVTYGIEHCEYYMQSPVLPTISQVMMVLRDTMQQFQVVCSTGTMLYASIASADAHSSSKWQNFFRVLQYTFDKSVRNNMVLAYMYLKLKVQQHCTKLIKLMILIKLTGQLPLQLPLSSTVEFLRNQQNINKILIAYNKNINRY